MLTPAERRALADVRALGRASARDVAERRPGNPARVACGVGRTLWRLHQAGWLRVATVTEHLTPVYEPIEEKTEEDRKMTNPKQVSLFLDDLSTATLRAIKEDLSKYAHLRAYEDAFHEVAGALKERDALAALRTTKD